MSFSYATVVDAISLSPRLRRIVVQVDDVEALAVAPGGDSAVGVYFPMIDTASGAQGRTYSVRRQDGDRIALDIFVHARGPGTAWASSTGPGDRVGLDHARSWYRPEPATAWQLLVADLSGLPAAARIIDELPDGMPVTAIVEVAESADLDYLSSHQDVTVIPHVGSGNGHAQSQLARLVRELALPGGRGYCWFAGEAAESRAVRAYLRGRGWSIEQYDITGYWRLDSEAWDAKFALVDDDVLAVYERALADGKGEKAAAEEFDDALQRVGL